MSRNPTLKPALQPGRPCLTNVGTGAIRVLTTVRTRVHASATRVHAEGHGDIQDLREEGPGSVATVVGTFLYLACKSSRNGNPRTVNPPQRRAAQARCVVHNRRAFQTGKSATWASLHGAPFILLQHRSLDELQDFPNVEPSNEMATNTVTFLRQVHSLPAWTHAQGVD
jgi:hypothetical protein